ncbi:MAG: Ig-like domain-containing protein, partial [Betaproteobacteria bacterium]
MSRQSNAAATFLRWLSTIVTAGLFAGAACAQSIPSYVGSGPLLPLILQMPANSWLQVNANAYSDVWTPPSREPLDNGSPQNPSKIILPWSSFAWDSNRGDIILYGGGHANYPGNDVYRWHSTTLQWERASLPSEIYNDPVAGFLAIDGVDNAPISSHTYDNNIFLPIVDRFQTWGGATYNNGFFYVRVSETNPNTTRPIGPYLFDPNRADGNKVGGTTGSNVKRVDPTSIAGGQMWQNRDIFLHIPNQALPGTHVNGCTGYAAEGGHDVVYTAASSLYGTTLDLYRYQLTDLANPFLDQSTKVGVFSAGVTGQTTCGYDPVRKLFVRTGNNTAPFQFWDLTSPDPANPDKNVQIESTIANLQSWLSAQGINIQNCALEFDPSRGTFLLWCGGGAIWELHEPPSSNTVSGWSVTQRTQSSFVPPGIVGTGIMGKWHYAPYYDVFVGLEDANQGEVWLYKPVGWVQPNPPGNSLPTVSITSPADGTTVVPATPLSLTANASDPGGSIARVEYYANGLKLGQATAAPYTVAWKPIPVGTYAIVAVAVDNVGGMTLSAPVNLTVNATLSTVTLQRGLNGYAGASDTFLDNTARTLVHDASNPLYLDLTNYSPLLRFAIYQSEGGPVPNGTILQSASLQLYKQFYDETVQLNALLKPWVEAEATWNLAQTGTAWSLGGASAAGSDYDGTADDLLTPSFSPGWVAFDVTARVQQWANNRSANFGWRLSQTTVGNNPKTFNSSEYTTDATLRPKLTVVYSGGSSNAAPMATLLTPADGATMGLGGSFTLTASASDPDGTVSKVEYYAGAVKVGQATSSPYTFVWTPSASGTYVLTAVATDNGGLTGTSTAATVTVTAVTGTTVVLQRGLNGYALVSDTFLDKNLQTTVRGAMTPLYLDSAAYTPLIRFGVFQAEGGPVPTGATIQSATLQLYKQYYDDTIRLNPLLKPWVENQATWLLSQTGIPWTTAGAAGVGSDYASSADAVISVPFNPGWVTFDVTARIQQWANNSSTNFGWRL